MVLKLFTCLFQGGKSLRTITDSMVLKLRNLNKVLLMCLRTITDSMVLKQNVVNESASFCLRTITDSMVLKQRT